MIHRISAPEDGGNITLHDIVRNAALLSISPDSPGNWRQWFYFELYADPGTICELRILNASECSYPDGWINYRSCVSEGDTWRRTDTIYDGNILTIRYKMEGPRATFAYFEPYPLSRHRELISGMGERWPVHSLGKSLDGHSIDHIRIGKGPFNIWLIGRQHSGETMASWWMEGALQELEADYKLQEFATVNVVPIVNPDGVVRGNLRANSAGVDLNRQWRNPRPSVAPEVACIIDEMNVSGVDLCLDVHGDEAIPHVFVDGCEMISAPTKYQLDGLSRFKSMLLRTSKSFQTRVGYPLTFAGNEANGMAARALATRFGAIAMTLEMPFKDSLECPDSRHGWSALSSKALGGECIRALRNFLSIPEA